MKDLIQAPTQPYQHCDACFARVTDDDTYCAGCGYPLKGSENEQKKFIDHRNKNDVNLPKFKKKVARAGNTLYYLSAVFILYSAISFFTSANDPYILAIVIPYLILAILFLILGSFSKQKPLACFISGLCLYVIVQVLIFINDPEVIDTGIIIKIVIIGFLVKGIKSAVEVERIKNENNIA